MKKILAIITLLLLTASYVHADDVSIDSQGNVTTGVSNSAANLEVTGSDEDGIVGTTTGTGKAGVYGGHSSGNYGLLGDDQYGVYGESSSGEAGHFQGDATVTGDLTVGGALNATVGNTDTVDGKHAADFMEKAAYDVDGNGKPDRADDADTAQEATQADMVDGKHAADLLDKVTYDTNADGKVNSAVSADDSDMVDGQHASDIISAAADEVRTPISACGTAVTAAGSYYLTGNISVTSGICIDVSVSNVTIDLMGFTVTGAGGTGADHGIYIHGASNVEVRNGTLRNFTQGIWATGTSNTSIRVMNVRALQNLYPGISVSPKNSKIMNCLVDGNGTGIFVYDGSTVANNKVYSSGNKGIHVAGTGNTIEGNHIIDSGYGIYFEVSGNYSYNNRLSGNTNDYYQAELQQGNDINEIRACGTSISTSGSYYVTGDLSATGTCITVTADNVTIDLAGFTLAGDGGSGDYGVYINNASNVEVKNGTVTNFQRGVYAYRSGSANSNRAVNVRAVSNTDYGMILNSYNNLVRDCTAAFNSGPGVSVGEGSTVINNTSYSNGGAGIIATNGSLITSNSVRDNQQWGIFALSDSNVTGNMISGNNKSNVSGYGGLYIFADSLVKGNSLDSNLQNNIYAGSSGNTIEGNLVTDSGTGIYFTGSGNFSVNNRLSGNTSDYYQGELQHGNDINEIRSCGKTISTSGSYYVTGDISATGTCITVTADNVTIDLKGFTLSGDGGAGDYGIYINDVSNVEVTNGTVTNFQYGILAHRPSTSTANSNRVVNVRAVSNTESGIILNSYNNILRDCTAALNTSLGIYAGYGSTVINNTSYSNGSTGISAGVGSTVSNNTSYSNGAGITTGTSSTVTNNTVRDNQGWGIFANSTANVTGNTISYNNLSNTTGKGGLYVFSGSLAKSNSLGNNLQNNIYVGSSDNSVEENLVTDSGNGIYFNTSGSFYANNRASGNTVNYVNTTGNTDGGGNASF